MDNISVELNGGFVEKYVRFANPQYIQVYIFARYLYEKNGEPPSAETLCDRLPSPPTVSTLFSGTGRVLGEIVQNNGEYAFADAGDEAETKKTAETPRAKSRKRTSAKMRPSYKSAEIDAAAERNSALSGMFYQAESILGHMLSGNEMELLYSFYDWLGLPCEVIVMLLRLCGKAGENG